MIFYQATRQAEADELRSFTSQCEAVLGGLPAGYVVPELGSRARVPRRQAGAERLAVILDEFPYLCESTGGLT